jgi:CheY-specific phosphatase CheX
MRAIGVETFYYIEDADVDHAVLEKLLDHAPGDAVRRCSLEELGRVREVLGIVSQATCEVIATITGENPVRKEAIMVASHARSLGGIRGCMKFSGVLTGGVAVNFNPSLARSLGARIAQCPESDLTGTDVLDGVGEIVNQLSGRVRTLLNYSGLSTDIELPNVCSEPRTDSSTPNNKPWYVLVYECLGQRFAVQVCLVESAINQEP